MPDPTMPAAFTSALPDDAVGHLRPRLLLVLLVAMVPMLAYLLVGAEATRHATLDWLEAELTDAAHQAAQHEAQTLGQAARLLNELATIPAAGNATCAALLPRLAGAPSGLLGLAVHGTDGRPECAMATDGSAMATDGFALAIGTAHVRAALATPNRVTMAAEGSGLVLARSLGTSGQGVLALILAPSHLPPLTLPLRRDQALRLLVDPNDGTVLAVQPRPGDAAPAAGATLLLPRLMAALRTGREAGVVLARDATGARRLIGYGMVPAIAGVGAGRVAMLVELPYDTLLDEADARRRDQWLAALALGLLGAASAWVLAQRSLVRPVGRLLAATSPAQRQNLAALRPAGEWLRQQSDLAAVVVASAEMFLRLDAEFHVRYASPATRAVLGYAPSEVVDADLAAEPGWGPCQEQLAQLRSGQAVAAPCHILARRRDDTEVRLEVRATRLPDGGYMLVCRDIASEVELRAQLAAAQALATALGSTDMESGLANSHRFDDALAEELRRARRAQEPLSLVLVRLAEPMDSAAQTEQARRMGRIVSAMLRRPGDLAARLDETLYAVLLPTTDRIGVQRLAERLHEAVVAALAQPAWTGACSVLPLSEAVGPEAVLDLARQALREAASPGGVGVALAVPEPERLAS